jgi:phosphoglycerate kinase
MAKLTVRDLNVHNKRVFVRVDYNVPLEEKDGQMVITDDTRIVETLPTLRCLSRRARGCPRRAPWPPKGQREPDDVVASRPQANSRSCSDAR